MNLTFDPSVNAGNLLVFIFAILAFIGAWYRFGGRLDLLEYRTDEQNKTLERISKALEAVAGEKTAMALIQQKQNAQGDIIVILQKELYDLRRGEGYIQSPRRANVDGEY